ncbi:MAG: hypothetical protein R3F37_16845 [Candidatus Competibacteraceae bacterium]
MEGQLLGETRTDQEGNFTFTTEQRVDHHLVADAGAGHQAEFTVSAQEIPTPPNALSATTMHADSKNPAISEDRLKLDSTAFQSLLENAIARQNHVRYASS